MEYGVRLETPGAPPEDPRTVCGRPWQDHLPPGRVVAVYFGAEFCEHALPTVDEAEAHCRSALQHGLEAVLLTPVVTDHGLAAVERLVAALVGRSWMPAVVFNDWGVLGLLRTRFPALPRRAGRLLNRGLRDPRGQAKRFLPGDRAQRLRRLLANMAVAAVETDPDTVGGYLGDGTDGMSRTLHLPFSFAASGRNCLIKATAHPGTGLTHLLGTPCPRPCRSGPRRVVRRDMPGPLWRAGNTLFSLPPPVRGPWDRVDRVVLHGRPAP